jgi:VanZ family protein
MRTRELSHRQACTEWSNRIFILSVIGIIYLTIFPFKFDFAAPHEYQISPFFLGTSTKPSHYIGKDFFLNVLLFVPFGFGICAQVRKRGGGLWTSFLLALILGAFTTYTVELLQLYIPSRDSGWLDVFSNTLGSVTGFCVFEFCSDAVLPWLSIGEDALASWLSPGRTAMVLLAYFAFCFGVSVPLQRETRLSNWDPDSFLVVGNDASGHNPWKGKILGLQIWDRALSDEMVRQIARHQPADVAREDMLASYDFTGWPPYVDKNNFLPPLQWTPVRPPYRPGHMPEWNGTSWLSTGMPAGNLMEQIKKTSRFTVHLICETTPEDVNGRVISFSKSAGNVNFLLRQEGHSLVLRLRNPLSASRFLLSWYVHGAFEPGKVTDIVALYDGSDAFIYVDGKRVTQSYRLGPGASIAHFFSLMQTEVLDGYITVYETVIFAPAGLLIGIAARKWYATGSAGRWTLILFWLAPAVLLEILLMGVSGRKLWIEDIVYSVIFGLAGMLLVNADPRAKNCSEAC